MDLMGINKTRRLVFIIDRNIDTHTRTQIGKIEISNEKPLLVALMAAGYHYQTGLFDSVVTVFEDEGVWDFVAKYDEEASKLETAISRKDEIDNG